MNKYLIFFMFICGHVLHGANRTKQTKITQNRGYKVNQDIVQEWCQHYAIPSYMIKRILAQTKDQNFTTIRNTICNTKCPDCGICYSDSRHEHFHDEIITLHLQQCNKNDALPNAYRAQDTQPSAPDSPFERGTSFVCGHVLHGANSTNQISTLPSLVNRIVNEFYDPNLQQHPGYIPLVIRPESDIDRIMATVDFYYKKGTVTNKREMKELIIKMFCNEKTTLLPAREELAIYAGQNPRYNEFIQMIQAKGFSDEDTLTLLKHFILQNIDKYNEVRFNLLEKKLAAFLTAASAANALKYSIVIPSSNDLSNLAVAQQI